MNAWWSRATSARWLRFNTIGGIGLLVQLGVLWLLTDACGLHPLVAAPIAIEATILHNFFWHLHWTWRDRPGTKLVWRLARFHVTNGAISVLGNLGLMAALIGLAKMHYLLANLLSVAVCSLVNFVVSDVVVFQRSPMNRVEVETGKLGLRTVRSFDKPALSRVEGRMSGVEL